jgi:hypothetical protein
VFTLWFNLTNAKNVPRRKAMVFGRNENRAAQLLLEFAARAQKLRAEKFCHRIVTFV